MIDEVIFLPNWSASNPYLNRLAEGLTRCGYSIRMADYPEGFFPLNKVVSRHPSSRIIHLHWVYSLVDPVVWSGNSMKRNMKLTLLMLDLFLARARGVRIVWTIHNLTSHESANVGIEVRVRRRLARLCSHVLVHSFGALKLVERTYGLSLTRNATVVPHGNYDGCYVGMPGGVDRLRARFGLRPENIVVLFFGLVRQYKGVERLIEAFRLVDDPNLRMVIAGKPQDQEFGDSILASAASDPRISCALGFVPDEDVSDFFALADLVALPFERTLTSGSATLAFTMGKALLVPDNARIFDFVSDQNAFFFETREELIAALSGLDKERLGTMGKSARHAVEKMDWSTIGKQVAAAYERLF